MKSFLGWIGGVLADLVTAAIGLAALAAVLGLAGRWAPRLDIFAHFAPLYAIVCLLGALVALAARLVWRRAVLLTCALGLLASGLMIVPEFTRLGGPPARPDAPGQIKVVQLNAHYSNTDIGRVADWLIAQHADIVTVSEARHDLRDLLVRRAGWQVAGARGDLMIFTRDHYLRMDRPRRPGGWDTTFVNATYATSSGPLEVVTTHLTWPTEAIIGQQMRDMEAIAAHRPRERMVLTGDMNATPWSAEVLRLDRSLGLMRRDRGLATFPAELFGRPWPLPFLPIDHVYAGRGWATVNVERGPWVGSDHYPLIVTLAPVAPR